MIPNQNVTVVINEKLAVKCYDHNMQVFDRDLLKQKIQIFVGQTMAPTHNVNFMFGVFWNKTEFKLMSQIMLIGTPRKIIF